MLKKAIVICLLIGASYATEDQDTDGAQNNVKRDAPPSSSYGPPSSSHEKEPAPVYGPPSSPQSYSKSIPAAAIRNVETVAVTKTITPVVTKTTTYNTHSEPALSIGHVQGYSQSAQGHPKVAPVQFQTQYTSYHNPTVGVNGPVTYSGPAMVFGGGYAIPLTGLSLSSSGSYSSGGSPSSSYGAPSSSAPSSNYGAPALSAPSSSYGAPSSSATASTYGPPSQSPGTPLGSYSNAIAQYVAPSVRGSVASPLSLLNIQQLQQLRAPARQTAAASSYSPVAIRAVPNSPYYAFYQPQYQPRPISPVALATAASSPVGAALRYQYQRSPVYQRQQHQPISQPTTYVQTYAMPSVSFTRLEPVSALNKNLLQSNQHATIQRAISH